MLCVIEEKYQESPSDKVAKQKYHIVVIILWVKKLFHYLVKGHKLISVFQNLSKAM